MRAFVRVRVHDDLDHVYFFVVGVRQFHAIKYSSLISIVSARVESIGS